MSHSDKADIANNRRAPFSWSNEMHLSFRRLFGLDCHKFLQFAVFLLFSQPVASFTRPLFRIPSIRNQKSTFMIKAMTDLSPVSVPTLLHYSLRAEAFWLGTKDHDVTQNRDALIRNLKSSFQGTERFDILDLGCGPGRDIKAFLDLGHRVTGRL